MGHSLIPESRHSQGALFYDGRGFEDRDGGKTMISNAMKDQPIEFRRARQVRSQVLDPQTFGVPQSGNQTTPYYGSGGFRFGSQTGAHMDVNLSGTRPDGSLAMRTTGGANDGLTLVGPPGLKPESDTKIKFSGQCSIEDVSATSMMIGLGFDSSDGNGPPDLIDLASGLPTGDGIYFHRLAATASDQILFSVVDGGSIANSTTTLTLPSGADFLDDTYFEVGFVVDGLSSIRAAVKVPGHDEVVSKQTRVAGSVLDLLTSSLNGMGICAALHHAGAATEALNLLPCSAVQTYGSGVPLG